MVGIVLLLAWRSVEVVAYRRLRGAKRVMLLGPPEMLNRAVMNYMANKATRHRLTHVVRGHYLEQIRSHINEFDTAYVSDDIPSSERVAIYDLLLSEDKEIFMSTSFEHMISSIRQ